MQSVIHGRRISPRAFFLSTHTQGSHLQVRQRAVERGAKGSLQPHETHLEPGVLPDKSRIVLSELGLFGEQHLKLLGDLFDGFLVDHAVRIVEGLRGTVELHALSPQALLLSPETMKGRNGKGKSHGSGSERGGRWDGTESGHMDEAGQVVERPRKITETDG